MPNITLSQCTVSQDVARALAEDVATGDISAQLIDASIYATANVITRQAGYFCGKAWVDEVFHQIDPQVKITWHIEDGKQVMPNQTLFTLHGKARSLLTGERCALNFVQLLSGITTNCRYVADLVKSTKVKILDTRKTVPGLRLAQKYAVACGGCYNHRLGLYDAFLIKENHIASCGGIKAAITAARQFASYKAVEVEVESITQLNQALAAKADIIMLDNFSLDLMRHAVKITNKTAKLEASGGIDTSNLIAIAQTGVDFISIGALTKNVQALDLSMRLTI